MTKQSEVIRKTIKYSTGFSAGALLFKESDAVISQIQNPEAFLAGDEIIPFQVIPVNSESSQKRLYSEVSKRLKSLDNTKLFYLFQQSTQEAKLLILFYATCKTYPVIADFMLTVVLRKWHNMDKEISAFDFQSFLYELMGSHPELEKLTPATIKKLSQVVMLMLGELGMQKDNMITKVDFDQQILEEIVSNGDNWFLEALLLNENERLNISAK